MHFAVVGKYFALLFGNFYDYQQRARAALLLFGFSDFHAYVYHLCSIYVLTSYTHENSVQLKE